MKREPPEGGSQRLGGQAETPGAYPGHQTEMRLLACRLAWLDRGREHWWARQLRWHRERGGPECACRSCT
jgi:hypothetical protein